MTYPRHQLCGYFVGGSTAFPLRPDLRKRRQIPQHGLLLIVHHQACKRTGAKLDVIPSDDSGELDLPALEDMLIAGKVKVVAITHVPTNGGVINPAKEGTRLSMSMSLAAHTAVSRECHLCHVLLGWVPYIRYY